MRFLDILLLNFYRVGHFQLNIQAKGYKLDVIIVDYLPLGKWEELAEIIKKSKIKKYYVTREVLDQGPENIGDLCCRIKFLALI